jgi:type VI secretion system secreted protein VgrG
VGSAATGKRDSDRGVIASFWPRFQGRYSIPPSRKVLTMASELTQTDRLLKIATPLGPNKLLLRSFYGEEEMSRLFSFHLSLVSEDNKINAPDIVGKNVTFSVEQADKSTERYFNGYVSTFAQLPSRMRLARYEAEVVPWPWFLTLTADCRIYQRMSVPDIIDEVFGRFGFPDYDMSDVKKSKHKPREYCVQYRETAFNFLSRLMEEEGIFYYFQHENGKHTMVLANHSGTHKPCPFQSNVRMRPAEGAGPWLAEDTIYHWEHHHSFRTGKWAQTDYNFETPSTSLLTTTNTVIPLTGVDKFEVFDYPGRYGKKDDGDVLTRTRMEEEEVGYDVIEGKSDCRSFSPGFKLTLSHHERKDQNATYVLTAVKHAAEQGGILEEDEGVASTYDNSFTCIPQSVTFRPDQITQKPVVHGCQTAVVVGKPGEEIFTNNFGQVKVQFHWDRVGKRDDQSSCWIRVSQPWAGKNWGQIWLPRMGQEVIVDFLEGDPDQPIIVGRVYNAEQMPPYDLPANQTQSGIKSRSSKQGSPSNFNEIRMEDKKGSEEIYIHAERNLTTIVEANESRSVGGARSTTIHKKDETLVIKDGNRSETLEKGNDKLEIQTGNRDCDILKGNDTLFVQTGNVEHGAPVGTYRVAAMNIVLEGTAGIKLMCGGSTIELLPAMITITSPLVKIN